MYIEVHEDSEHRTHLHQSRAVDLWHYVWSVRRSRAVARGPSLSDVLNAGQEETNVSPIVIIGSGLAGYTVARELRKLDKETPLYVITADDGCFYSKPMLSTALTSGKTPEQLATFSASQMASQLGATIMNHATVTAIDPVERVVRVDGQALPYAKLVLALGADPIKSTLTGNAADQVISVNDLADYARFRTAINGGKNVAIMGAGLIGCEFANDLANAGYHVQVIHPGNLPMGQLLPSEASRALHESLAQLGVQWHFGRKVEAVDTAQNGYHLTLSDGSVLHADVVLSAIGLRPRTALTQAAGLKVNRGIVVDNCLRTSAEHVYALGDCAEVDGMVLPYVLPIMQAARALAKTLSGTLTAVSYPAMPVMVKTPICPVVVCAHPRSAAGRTWQTTTDENGVRAVHLDAENNLQGFALTGKATAEKASLVQGLTAWL